MSHSMFLAAMLHVVVATAAAAQFPAELATGTRVRVVVPDSVRQEPLQPRQQALLGTIARLGGDTLYLAVPNTAGTLAVPRSSVRQISLSRGVPSRATSALRRGVEWAAAGALAFYAAQGYDDDASFRSGGEAAAVGAGIGFGIGAVIGAVWPTERWRRVTLTD